MNTPHTHTQTHTHNVDNIIKDRQTKSVRSKYWRNNDVNQPLTEDYLKHRTHIDRPKSGMGDGWGRNRIILKRKTQTT